MWTGLRRALSRLRFVAARTRHDADAAAELEMHVAMLTERYERAGLAPGEARIAARRQLGNLTQVREEIHRMNSIGWLGALGMDLRYAVRMVTAKSRLQHGRDRDARPRDRRQHRHRQRGLCRAGEAAAVRAPRRDPQRADRDSGTPGAVREHSGVDSDVPGLARRANGPERPRRAPAVGVHPDRRRRTGARRRGAGLEQLLRDARGARRARPRLLQRGGANRAGARGGNQRRAMAAALRRGSAPRRPVDHDQRRCPRRRRHRATVAAGANRLAPARAAAIRAARRHLEAPRSHTGRARRRELGPRRARAGAGTTRASSRAGSSSRRRCRH